MYYNQWKGECLSSGEDTGLWNQRLRGSKPAEVSNDPGTYYSSVVRASELQFEDPGFDPLAGQGEERVFSVPPSQLLCRFTRA